MGPRDRYANLASLLGEAAVARIRGSKVLVAGAGGLGSLVLYHLVASGVGRIVVVDPDTVEEANLDRQLLYSPRDVGRYKAYAAREALENFNPEVSVEPVVAPVQEVADDLVRECDVVVDALDNWDARYALDRACSAYGKPLVHGAVEGFYGHATVVVPGETACLRCLFPGLAGKRALKPTAGPVAGVIASIQALETVTLLAGERPALARRLLIVDARSMKFEVVEVSLGPDCPACTQ